MAKQLTRMLGLTATLLLAMLATGRAQSTSSSTTTPGSTTSSGGSSTSVSSSSKSSCLSRFNGDVLAVSIVYAVCGGNVVLAAQSIAKASVAGCGDTYAASIGVSIATIHANGNGGLKTVITEAFNSAFAAASTFDTGRATAEALTVAIASATPSSLSRSDMLVSLTAALAEIAPSAGCQKIIALSESIAGTLAGYAPDLLGQFTEDLKTFVGPICGNILNQVSSSYSTTYVNGVLKVTTTGSGLGHIGKAVFSPDIYSKKTSATLAVTIAQTACPTQGDASVAAIAVATTYNTDKGAAVDAIAAVVAQGVDLSAVMYQVFAGENNQSAVKAVGTALAVVTPTQQQQLLNVIISALNKIATGLGCTPVQQNMEVLKTVVVNPMQFAKLCSMVSCPGIC